MSIATRAELDSRIQEKLQQLPPADWVREMVAHYFRTGTYRAEDLRHLLGDPNQAVEVGPNASFASHFAASRP